MHYLGNNFVLMVQEAHKQGYLIDSPLHADIAATLNQPMNSPPVSATASASLWLRLFSTHSPNVVLQYQPCVNN